MQATTEITRDLVLVGGGHAHALVLRMLAMQPIPGVRITLISPATHTPYSGMLPGLVAGHYSFAETHIDLARLCQWAGVRFLAAEVTAIHPETNTLCLRGRPNIEYELLSVDTGSEPELDSVPGARDWAVPVKPVAGLWQRWQDLSGKLGELDPDTAHRIAVVGGGAGSVELIMAMAQRFSGRGVGFALFCGADEILQDYNPQARRSVEKALNKLGIEVHLGARVVSVERRSMLLGNDTRQEFDNLFWCTGAAAAPWIAASGLQVDQRGFMFIRDTLQAMDYDNVFAAGDVASQRNHPRPKAGVYAVRQGPVLAGNLRAWLLKKPLQNHVPQTRFLSLISLGEKNATADRGMFTATGHWVWRWKDHIDRAFMSRFENLPTHASMNNAKRPPGESAKQQLPCGGCGAKIGARGLTSVLADLAAEFPEHCPNGARVDDTASIPGSAGVAIIQSIDVLREMVSDPWLMGRIAANHALSDLYASGAMPLSALASVTLPFASAAIQERELKQFLAGALHEFSAVDCKLLGGHTMQGQELNIGFVVNGSAMSDSRGLLHKQGLKVGDHLLLTKPLGTGTLFASHMQLKADGRHVQLAVETMLQSNAKAGELAVQHGASAGTDVTGFGLLGHLLEMLAAGQGAKLSLSAIPLLAGAIESIRAGVFSTMHGANTAAKKAIGVTSSGLEPEVVDLLVDPQTSGGLLIGIAADKSHDLCIALRAAGYENTAIVGQITSCKTSRPGLLYLE